MDGVLPQGADALLVHGWVNEIQMLLHEHPINAAREARGALAVNSLWLWGAGQLVQPRMQASASVWTEDPLLRGLARASGLPVYAPPASAEDWLAHAETGEHWILLDAAATSREDQASDWREDAERLERLWFAPLLAALSARRLSKLTLATHYRGQALRFCDRSKRPVEGVAPADQSRACLRSSTGPFRSNAVPRWCVRAFTRCSRGCTPRGGSPPRTSSTCPCAICLPRKGCAICPRRRACWPMRLRTANAC